MAISEPYELDGVTVSTTAISLVSGTTSTQSITDDGVYAHWVDPGAMAKGDTYEFCAYEKVLSGSSQKCYQRQTLSNVQDRTATTPGDILIHGWDARLKGLAGADAAFDTSTRKLSGGTITEAYTQSALSIATGVERELMAGTTWDTADVITTDGVYQFWLDLTMVKADRARFRIYEKVEGTGGTTKVIFENWFANVQSCIWRSPCLTLINGWAATVMETGATITVDASTRRIG